MSKVFPKLAKSITMAAKNGGPDPESNAPLRVAINNAKAQNLSRENIENAIKRAVPVARVIQFSKDNHRWTQSEERAMINMRRHENMTFHEIGMELHRSPEAINLRFRKLVDEHVGDDDVARKEVLRWFNLTE
jgi:YesN/AraC family two-component response regulator